MAALLACALVATAYGGLQLCFGLTVGLASAQCGLRLGAGLGIGCALPCWPMAAGMSAAATARMAWWPLTATGYDDICLCIVVTPDDCLFVLR